MTQGHRRVQDNPLVRQSYPRDPQAPFPRAVQAPNQFLPPSGRPRPHTPLPRPGWRGTGTGCLSARLEETKHPVCPGESTVESRKGCLPSQITANDNRTCPPQACGEPRLLGLWCSHSFEAGKAGGTAAAGGS